MHPDPAVVNRDSGRWSQLSAARRVGHHAIEVVLQPRLCAVPRPCEVDPQGGVPDAREVFGETAEHVAALVLVSPEAVEHQQAPGYAASLAPDGRDRE